MKDMRLKKITIYGLYCLAMVTLFGSVYLVEFSSKTIDEDDIKYVDQTILDKAVPVTNVSLTLIRPYSASNVSLARGYYDHTADFETQQNALIFYEGTYMPNSGVDYKSDEKFDVLAIFDGEVTKVSENTLLGKIIEVTHENNLISVYQSLSDVSIVEGDRVIRGQIIGTSGTANISSDLGNHLHFEIISNGVNINPELCFDKKIGEL